MKCPICGARLHPGADRCQDCGCHVRTHTEPLEHHPTPRKRRHWGCLILPFLGLLPIFAVVVISLLINLPVRPHMEPARPAPVPEASVTIPAAPETIPISEADEGCFSIRSGAITFLPEKWTGERVLQIPETIHGEQVLSLAPGCFDGCADLTTIVLPETLTLVGREAFSGCTNLRGLYLPDAVESIGTDAFADCVSLEAIYVPASVTTISEGCFSDCASLLYIFYNGSFERWNELYSGYITPFTTAICQDGNYYHGTGR